MTAEGSPKNSTEKSVGPIQLAHDDGRPVVITPETMDRFVFPASKAVSACVNHAQFETFQRTMQDRFQKMCEKINRWSSAHQDVVRTLFDYRDGGTYLLLLVVKGPVPNPELDDQISDLDMEVYRDFPEFPMSMMTVPSDRPGAVSAFVNPEGALVIYANTPRTPSRC